MAEASEAIRRFSFDLSELDITEDQWQQMPPSERNFIIQTEVDKHDQPHWSVTTIKEKQ